ncbi:MAG: transposase, partial [Planctomycetes bacterium]|nr:transposase [Planctomycetota bacterium]
MIQELLYHEEENKKRSFSNPPLALRENKRSPLLSYAGIAPVRDLISKLSVASTIDEDVSVLQRHKPYYESDHVLNFVYNFLTGGETINDIERLQESEGLLRLLGTKSIPDPTTAGDFLVRFQQKDILDFQGSLDKMQDAAFSLLDSKRKEWATIEQDSSIHQIYGEKKEGGDYAYENTYSYIAQYVTLAETGDVLHQDLREGSCYATQGLSKILPGIMDRVSKHFKHLRYRADSASYDKDIVEPLEQRGVEFYISAKQTQRLMREVQSIDEREWKCFRSMKLTPATNKEPVKKRKKRKNHKRAVKNRRKPHRQRRGKTQITSFEYQPIGWDKPYRFVAKRTEVVDEHGQLYLEEGLCKYIYHIIVTNNTQASNTRAMHIAQGRSNQENL